MYLKIHALLITNINVFYDKNKHLQNLNQGLQLDLRFFGADGQFLTSASVWLLSGRIEDVVWFETGTVLSTTCKPDNDFSITFFFARKGGFVG